MKRGVLFAALLSLLVSLSPRARADSPPATVPSTQPGGKAVIIQLAGEIDDYNRDALFARFDDARKLGAKVIILDIDTYGGLVTAGLDISRYIKRQDDLHVIAYVKDKAISAGSMIAMSCDEIVMGSSSSIGDCAPIMVNDQGLQTMGDTERAKMEAPILEDFKDSAQRNHHDPVLAAAMVSIKRSVYWVQNKSGERRFVDAAEYIDLKTAGQWSDVPGVAVPIDGEQSLLCLNTRDAVEYGLATGPVASAEDLAKQRGYEVVENFTPGWGEKFVAIIGSAAFRGLLIIIFLVCLYATVSAPGHGVAEACGLLALLLMLGVPLLNGYAQWWEILMIFIGLGLVAVEIAAPGHLLPGITGGILVVVGLLLTFVPIQPGGISTMTSSWTSLWMALRTGIYTMAIAMASTLVIWYWMGRFLPRLPYFNKLILTQTSGAQLTMPGPLRAGNSLSPAGNGSSIWPPIGAVGRAVTELKPGGSAEFFDAALADGRVTSVISERGYISAGAEIVVKSVDGPSITVRQRT